VSRKIEHIRSQRENQGDVFEANKHAKKFIEKFGYFNINPCLRFDKFIKIKRERGKTKFDYSDSIKRDRGVHRECFEVPEEIKSRIEANFKYLRNLNSGNSCLWCVETAWRMVVGLGSPHVHETAMTWHHTWSIPYIPGSALKGVTRAYFIEKAWEKFEKENQGQKWEDTVLCLEAWLMGNNHLDKRVHHKKEECPLWDWAERNLQEERELFKAIFGTQEQKGSVIFMDAYPLDKYCLKLDVMNVHYPDYYDGVKDYAADWESPRPVYFLTVVDTKFQGLILVNKKFLENSSVKISAEKILNSAQSFLKNALEWHGIGAKTAIGYGILK